MNGGDLIQIDTVDWNGDEISYVARVLYWWEVQEARHKSVIADPMTAIRHLDMAKFKQAMIEMFLVSITSGGKTVEKSELRGKSWRGVMHPRAIPLIYDEYNKRCHPTSMSMEIFSQDVNAYFNPTSREGLGVYVAPPEIFEVIILSRLGGMTLAELRELSYAQLKKYMIVTEHLQSQPTTANSNLGIGGNSLMNDFNSVLSGTISTSTLSNENLSPDQATLMSNRMASDLAERTEGHIPSPSE